MSLPPPRSPRVHLTIGPILAIGGIALVLVVVGAPVVLSLANGGGDAVGGLILLVALFGTPSALILGVPLALLSERLLRRVDALAPHVLAAAVIGAVAALLGLVVSLELVGVPADWRTDLAGFAPIVVGAAISAVIARLLAFGMFRQSPANVTAADSPFGP